ncbi:hypothetical protein B0T19DRAFT_45716 [Cercophora scortea]|uniref:Uncharacterized protein n=1 Tax=Cercophora scortea TaxID=314031 RepID=A0AAE0MM24_9PEZI|nr:hypothetical protein B0T19DRAFT_45716 [Cercophora scortea]
MFRLWKREINIMTQKRKEEKEKKVSVRSGLAGFAKHYSSFHYNIIICDMHELAKISLVVLMVSLRLCLFSMAVKIWWGEPPFAGLARCCCDVCHRRLVSEVRRETELPLHQIIIPLATRETAPLFVYQQQRSCNLISLPVSYQNFGVLSSLFFFSVAVVCGSCDATPQRNIVGS